MELSSNEGSPNVGVVFEGLVIHAGVGRVVNWGRGNSGAEKESDK